MAKPNVETFDRVHNMLARGRMVCLMAVELNDARPSQHYDNAGHPYLCPCQISRDQVFRFPFVGFVGIRLLHERFLLVTRIDGGEMRWVELDAV